LEPEVEKRQLRGLILVAAVLILFLLVRSLGAIL
jgi:hypothetical protein